MIQKGSAPILILVLILVFAVGIGGAYYLGRSSTKSQTSVVTTPTAPATTPAVTSANETANWKTYTSTSGKYSFQYPSDWSLENSDYLNTNRLTNKNKTVALSFSDNQYPYGFSTSEDKFERNDFKLKVDEKDYKVVETIVGGKSVFVDFKTEPTQIYILFGTGYPAFSGGVASKDEYENDKKTIIKILSTFKFLK